MHVVSDAQLKEQQEISNRRKERTELVWLIAVMGILWSGYLSSGFWKSSESIRYEKDIVGFTPGIAEQRLLDTECAHNLSDKLFPSSTNIFTTIKSSLGQSDNNTDECRGAFQRAQRVLGSIHHQMDIENRHLMKMEREKKRSFTETGTTYDSEPLTMRQKALGLDKKGQIEAIEKAKVFFRTQGDERQVLSALAVASGDTKFKYSKLYADNREISDMLNDAAKGVSVVNAHTRNLERAISAQVLLEPFGAPSEFRFGAMVQFSVWVLLTWILLRWTRRILYPFGMIPYVMIGWGMVGVSFGHALVSAKWMLWLIIIGVILILLNHLSALFRALMHGYRIPRWHLASRFAYPGFVLFTGIGLLLIMDISSRGAVENRFIILKHICDLMMAFAIVSIIPLFSVMIGILMTKGYAAYIRLISWPEGEREQKKGMIITLFFFMTVPLLAWAIHKPYQIADVMKLWLIFGMGLFFTLNADRMVQRDWLRRRFVIPLLLSIGIPILSLGAIGEMGTMLVLLYASAILIGGMWSYRIFIRGGISPVWSGILLTLVLMAIFTLFIDGVGAIHSRTAERLISWHAPFESVNEDMAIIHWFRESAPFFGYGFGSVPWGGYTLGDYNGVPKQIQSDYTITSMIVVYGKVVTVFWISLYATWILHSLRAVWEESHAGRIGPNKHESPAYVFIAWSGLVWAVVTITQMLLTSAGNLGVLPLTGITFPFVSYGGSSLWSASFLLAMIINRPFIEYEYQHRSNVS